tara:strand:+ start:15646 stop:16683 length:1038 start_codon:yes stop_codon:yes gene_type:complete
MSKKILILGVNGFIGNWLTETILKRTDWEVFGMDMQDNKLGACLGNPRFKFFKGDITKDKEWIENHVRECDVVLPLVAIANPAMYVKAPLRVFELDFEANLDVVRLCVKYNKRIIFPSTSEVYGMSQDEKFDEETSNLVLGPIHKQRWIYSCSKQLLDRVIYAYGLHNDLDYTIFRPFNWLGPKMDDVYAPKVDSSRAVIQFISNILYQRPIKLVDGGKQRRCFTYIQDGIDALIKIIENKDGSASRRIFNVGNPKNDHSIKEVVDILLDVMKDYPSHKHLAEATKVEIIDASRHFGEHYEDVTARVPSIDNAKKHLDWNPEVDLRTALKKTLDYHLIDNPQEIK